MLRLRPLPQLRLFTQLRQSTPQRLSALPRHHVLQRRHATTAPTPFLLTDIGEGITEVEVIKYYVSRGDRIAQFQPLVEVQSDKATVQIPSRYDGVVHSLAYHPGDIARVGNPLCHIRTSASDLRATPEHAQASNPAPTQHDSSQSQQPTMNEQTVTQPTARALAAPPVRALARQHAVHIDLIPGSGKDGRVTREDVLKFVEQSGQPSLRPSAKPPKLGEEERIETTSAPPSLEDAQVQEQHEQHADDERETKHELVDGHEEPIRGLTRGMFKSMTTSASIPQLGLSDDVNMEAATTLKQQLNAHDVSTHITYMPIFMKAASMALTKYPILNARIREDGEAIVYQQAHNISVAIATADGLVVPNVKNVETLRLVDIATELRYLQALAEERKLTKEHLTGGTFTLSNIGSIGGTVASPVVFSPQVAIGALGSIQSRATVLRNGELGIARMVSISWAADHRIIDGATVAQFNQTWKTYVENPGLMLSQLR